MLQLTTPSTLAFGFGSFGWGEISVLVILGVLLFGKRLPEVGKSIGKGIVEFKRGLKDIGDGIENESSKPGNEPKAIADEPTEKLPEGDWRRVSQADGVEKVDPVDQSPGVEPQSNG